MPTTISAGPFDLARYARATRERSLLLEAEARRLEATLAQFAARCTEYRVPETDGLAGRLMLASRRLDELGCWVDGVGAAFAQADSGALRGLGELRHPGRPHPQRRAFATQLGALLHTLVRFRGNPALTLGAVGADTAAAAWEEHGDTVLAQAAELSGAAQLARAVFLLQHAMAGGVSVLHRVNVEHGPDAAALLMLEAAWLLEPRLPLHLLFDDGLQALAWNALSAELLARLGAVEGAFSLSGPFWPLAVPPLVATVGTPLLVCGLGVGALSIVTDAPHWVVQPMADSDDALDLAQRSFWNQSFQNANPLILRQLAARVDTLSILLARITGGQASHSPPAENPRWQGTSVADAYTAISYAAGEQLVLERLNADGDYRISLAGLDPSKPGAPNNFEAVIITGYFPPAANHYYQHVRERFFQALSRIPPGSTLHLQGHSMGGGMSLLLRADPEVQRRLTEAQVHVASLTLYGAVVPVGTDFAPPALGPFADTELRAFVNTSDSLALNVGAGYGGFPDVQLLGGPAIDAPAHAHSDYANPEHYAELPDAVVALPYAVDPEQYERTAPAPPPVVIEEPPVFVLPGA
jgi:hypothetical protein